MSKKKPSWFTSSVKYLEKITREGPKMFLYRMKSWIRRQTY